MAKPTTTTFGKFLIELESATPGTYTAPCGFTQKGFTITAATSDTNVPDCDNPEAASWLERGITSLSAEISGSGVMALESLDTWRTWLFGAGPKNVRVHVNENAAMHGGYYAFSALCTSLGHTTTLGSDGNKVQLSVSVVSSGPVTWTPSAT